VLNSKLSQKILQDSFGVTYLSVWDKMAYDAGMVASYAIGSQDFSKQTFIQRLANSSGYVGISGALRFNDYITQRKYDIIKRSGYSYDVLDKDHSKF
jgi:hypothetical protein